MSDTVNQIASAFETWKQEDEKFENGNGSAGTRARKALQEIAKLVKVRRAEISEEKTSRKEAKIAS
ncbi:MAG: hypothetical protein EBU90_31165 [Proteobacteria bacterium]|jgi:hypothetical protein|nr:hypothetical protein [Pseudomonadota bacterium]